MRIIGVLSGAAIALLGAFSSRALELACAPVYCSQNLLSVCAPVTRMYIFAMSVLIVSAGVAVFVCSFVQDWR